MADIHTCSSRCHRPECTRRQRDLFRDWIVSHYGVDMMAAVLTGRAANPDTAHPLTDDLGPEGE